MPEGRERATRFARNTGWSVLGQGSLVVLAFFATPYLVRGLGTEAYGLYIFLHAATTYLTILTFNAASVCIKYTAEFKSAGAAGALRRTWNLSLMYHIAGVALGSAVLALGAPWIVHDFLTVPADLQVDAVRVFRFAALGTGFFALTQFYMGLLQGHQRFKAQAGVMWAQSGGMTLGAVLLVYTGHGVLDLARWYAALNVGLGVAGLGLSFFMRPDAGAPHPEDGRPTAREFALYCASMTLAQFAGVVATQFDKAFVGARLPIQEVTYYAVPAGILQRLSLIPAVIMAVLVPILAEIRGGEAEEDLRRVYVKAVRVLLWVMMPPLILFFTFMPQFLTLWLGYDFAMRSTWVGRCLVVAQGLALLAFIANSASLARGAPRYLAIGNWVKAVVSVSGWFLLVERWGILGVAASLVAAETVSALVYLIPVHRNLLAMPAGRYLKEGLLPPVLSATALLIVVFPVHAMASSWLSLIALGLLGTAAYYGATWFLLIPDDRRLVKRMVGL